MLDRVPAIVAGAYALLGVLSFVPVFTRQGSLSGIFAVLLGTPWTQLLSRALDAIAPSRTGGVATGLVLAAVGIAVNVAVLYFAARWIAGRLPR